jgi:geranyl-CoA carboxylase beta subunit
MPIIELDHDRNSADFQANRAAMQEQIEASERHQAEGASTRSYAGQSQSSTNADKCCRTNAYSTCWTQARRSWNCVALAGYMMHDDKDGTEAGGGIISGIGFVNGVRCLVTASNSAIKGGTISPAGLQKSLRLQHIAARTNCPSSR